MLFGRQLFLSITVFVITTRLSCVSARIKLRGSGLQPRRYKVPTYFNPRGSCDGNAAPTHKRLARLWSKLRFHLAVLSNGTLQGVNDTYCQLTNRCKYKYDYRHLKNSFTSRRSRCQRIFTKECMTVPN